MFIIMIEPSTMNFIRELSDKWAIVVMVVSGWFAIAHIVRTFFVREK